MAHNKAKPMPPLELLQEYLELDHETGRLFWIKSKNSKHPVGKEAAVSTNGKKGYLMLGWEGSKYLKHRIVYFMATGVDPGASVVDHINGDKSDNRPANLRVATLKQNSQNIHGPMRNNKTGVLGVHWSNQNKSWCAKLTINGKQRCRFFKNFDDAVAEIQRLREEHYGEYSGSITKCA